MWPRRSGRRGRRAARRCAPTARIAACGGLMTAVKWVTPYMPRFETVNVPPASSGGRTVLSRTRSARARVVRAMSPSDLRVGVEDRRDDERVLAGDGDADVDAGVQFEAAVAVGAVGAGELAQGERGCFDDHVVERWDGLVVAGGVLELGAQRAGGGHVDVGGDREVGDGRLGFGHAAGDDLLQARELLDVDLALGAGRGGLGRGRRRRGAAAGGASGAAWRARSAGASAAASTSDFTMRPSGPVPTMALQVDVALAGDASGQWRCLHAVAAVAGPRRRARRWRRRRRRPGRAALRPGRGRMGAGLGGVARVSARAPRREPLRGGGRLGSLADGRDHRADRQGRALGRHDVQRAVGVGLVGHRRLVGLDLDDLLAAGDGVAVGS